MRKILIVYSEPTIRKKDILISLTHSLAEFFPIVLADIDIEDPITTNLHKKAICQKSVYYGRIASIDTQTCIHCDLCLEGCRFGAIYLKGDFKVDDVKCAGCGLCELLCAVESAKMVRKPIGKIYACFYEQARIFAGETDKPYMQQKQMREEIFAQALKYHSIRLDSKLVVSLSGRDGDLELIQPEDLAIIVKENDKLSPVAEKIRETLAETYEIPLKSALKNDEIVQKVMGELAFQ